jgi:hypothetical protein
VRRSSHNFGQAKDDRIVELRAALADAIASEKRAAVALHAQLADAHAAAAGASARADEEAGRGEVARVGAAAGAARAAQLQLRVDSAAAELAQARRRAEAAEAGCWLVFDQVSQASGLQECGTRNADRCSATGGLCLWVEAHDTL